nr:hypothetical protein [Tanacetum cinerariifolium]
MESLNSKEREMHQLKQMQDKAKESCMVSSQQLHSYLKALSNNDSKGTCIKGVFERAFATLFDQDFQSFTASMLRNLNQIGKQLDKEEFHKTRSMDTFRVLKTQFQLFINFSYYFDDFDGTMTCKLCLNVFLALPEIHITSDLLDFEGCTQTEGKITELDADEDVTLEEVDSKKDAEFQGRLPESQAQVYHLDLEHAQKVLIRNVDSSSKFYMYPRFLQHMINAQIADLSSHNTKYTSLVLTQKVFTNMRMVGKGFSQVDTPLYDGMLVPQQVHDEVAEAAEDEDAANKIYAEPTPPSPTPATTPPPQQELIPLPLQVESTPPPSPHQSPIAQPSSPLPQQPYQPEDISHYAIDLLNQLLETCATLTRKLVIS